MAKSAENFAYRTKLAWETRRGEHDANVRAIRLGGVAIGPAVTPNHWYRTFGDAPATLYRFPDGSVYIVGNDGHWITAARNPTRKRARFTTTEAERKTQ